MSQNDALHDSTPMFLRLLSKDEKLERVTREEDKQTENNEKKSEATVQTCTEDRVLQLHVHGDDHGQSVGYGGGGAKEQLTCRRRSLLAV